MPEVSACGQESLLLDVALFAPRSHSPLSVRKYRHLRLFEFGIQRVSDTLGLTRLDRRSSKKFTNQLQRFASYEQQGGSMERRYLVATVALVATFAIFSREFRSGHKPTLPCTKAQLMADLSCAKQYVAQQLMAKLEPYVDRRSPDEAQMVVELNMPELARVQKKVARAQVIAAQTISERQCDTALRARENARRAQEMAQRLQEMNTRAAERAQEMNLRASERAMEINVREIERAQRIRASAMERAQRAIDQSHVRMSQPGMPIHINVVGVSPVHILTPAPVAPEPPSVPLL
jgi:hypothetical protein